MEERSPDDGCAVPKIVWFSWLQGLDKAPEVVRVCLASQKRHLPDYELKTLAEVLSVSVEWLLGAE